MGSALHAVSGALPETTNPFVAHWKQIGDRLCLGNWEISFQGRPLKLESPYGEDDMGTFGVFSSLFPEEEDLAEGLREDDWILENIIWVADLFARNDVPVDEAHMRWFYRAVNAEDWRCSSCGTCL